MCQCVSCVARHGGSGWRPVARDGGEVIVCGLTRPVGVSCLDRKGGVVSACAQWGVSLDSVTFLGCAIAQAVLVLFAQRKSPRCAQVSGASAWEPLPGCATGFESSVCVYV